MRRGWHRFDPLRPCVADSGRDCSSAHGRACCGVIEGRERYRAAQRLASLLSLIGIALSLAGVASAQNVVTVDPALYQGDWKVMIPGGATLVTGGNGLPETISVPAGTYEAVIGFAGGASFLFEVAAGGAVSVPNGVSAVGAPNALSFNTTTISVNPGAYAGSWRFELGVTPAFAGPQSVVLVPGVTYSALVGSAGPSAFSVSVGAGGTVSVPNGISAVGGSATLDFNTFSLSVATGSYAGEWLLFNNITGNLVGDQVLTVVPGLRYAMVIGGTRSNARFDFVHADDGSGIVTVLNGVSASGGVDLLSFNSETIFVDPGTFAGDWEVGGVLRTTGLSSLTIVPMAMSSDLAAGEYRLYNMAASGGPFELFTVGAPCEVAPSSLSVGGEDFAIACGVCLDEDEDGFGDPGSPLCPAGDVADCDDTNASVSPAATELPGNVTDENCDGSLGECDPFAEWRNHGQFVRCVAHEVNDLRDAGLISDEEGDDLVSTAAGSDVGQ